MRTTVTVLVAMVPATALAHPAIDEARLHYENAAFTEALQSLEVAEHAPSLTAAELHDLLALRATIHFATRAEDAFRNSLRMLASIAPDYRFDPNLPPPFLEAWHQERDATQPLEVGVTVVEEAGRVRVNAHVDGAAASLVRGPAEIHVRPRGGDWRAGSNGSVVLYGTAARSVELYAEAIGPGGVVIAQHGSEENPRVVGQVPLGVAETRPAPQAETDPLPWLLAGAAGIVAVGLAIALIVVATQDGAGATTIHSPTL